MLEQKEVLAWISNPPLVLFGVSGGRTKGASILKDLLPSCQTLSSSSSSFPWVHLSLFSFLFFFLFWFFSRFLFFNPREKTFSFHREKSRSLSPLVPAPLIFFEGKKISLFPLFSFCRFLHKCTFLFPGGELDEEKSSLHQSLTLHPFFVFSCNFHHSFYVFKRGEKREREV